MTTTLTAIEQGLDFILGHFQNTIWPRSISTKATDAKQVVVYTREEALARFSQADFIDCRISAYPPNVLENPSVTQRFMGIRTATPAYLIIMVDLDRCNSKTDRGFNMAYTRVLGNIRGKLSASPTVLWSGRGYHIIQPLYSNGIILENIQDFAGLPNISLRFLRFAESYLSLKKADLQHNTTVSYNNCMPRIPGSINSKNGQEVKVIQKWNGIRPEINYLLMAFQRYLINEKYLELLNAQKRNRKRMEYKLEQNTNEINWIERLLQTPLADHRKNCIWRILSPYLLNKRKLSTQESFSIIGEWLDHCNQLRQLDFNVSQRINDGLDGATDGYMPIAYDRLKEENPELYQIISENIT